VVDRSQQIGFIERFQASFIVFALATVAVVHSSPAGPAGEWWMSPLCVAVLFGLQPQAKVATQRLRDNIRCLLPAVLSGIICVVSILLKPTYPGVFWHQLATNTWTDLLPRALRGSAVFVMAAHPFLMGAFVCSSLKATAMVEPPEDMYQPVGVEIEAHQLRRMNYKDQVQWYAPPERTMSVRELLADRLIHIIALLLAAVGQVLLFIHGQSLGTPWSRQVTNILSGLCFAVEIVLSLWFHCRAWDWTWAKRSLQMDRIGINFLAIGMALRLTAWGPRAFPCVAISVVGFMAIMVDNIRILRKELMKTPEELASTDASLWTNAEIIHLVAYVLAGWFLLGTVPLGLEQHDLPFLVGGIMSGMTFTIGIFFYVDQDEFNRCIWHLFSVCNCIIADIATWESMRVMAWHEQQQ